MQRNNLLETVKVHAKYYQNLLMPACSYFFYYKDNFSL